ncbi:MAG TPA: aminoglycoside phosphotransferase family protein [Gaiellaceae bacterium]
MADTGLTHEAWLERVPDLRQECVDLWGLRLGRPYELGAAGYAVRVDLPAGTPAVLKLIYPHREAAHEAEALRVWDGDGAVRLLAYDEDRWAMLLERCEPGALLARIAPEAALDVLIGLLPRLWKPAGDPFHTLADEAAWWIDSLPGDWEGAGHAVDRFLVDAAVGLLRELSASQGEQVLLHQDLHGDNVLSAEREPWLVIDPKPLIGERELTLAPIVRDYVLGHSKKDVLYRLDRLSSELGLDRERARGWTIGQTMAWGFDSTAVATHVETVRWLLEDAR